MPESVLSKEPFDPVALTAALIRCPSVTPDEAGALDLLQSRLEMLNVACTRLPFSQAGTASVDNLFARIGDGSPVFCFAGHVDVVPPGPAEAWSQDPFAAGISGGRLIGRGAVDMKGAVAAFVCALKLLLEEGPPSGSVVVLLTGDEEGPAINGTRKMLAWLTDNGHDLTDCLVGEPTNPATLGEAMKIGRRGSLNGLLRVHGKQGHAAYPHLALNPLPFLSRMVAAADGLVFDKGTDHFAPSALQFTAMETGNRATNVIPASAEARFNVRFNDSQTVESVEKSLRNCLDPVVAGTDCRYDLELDRHNAGECFITKPGKLTDLVGAAVKSVTGRTPELSTAGGTSDARFIKNHARVVEFGLISETMHGIDESVATDDLHALTRIYHLILKNYFSG